MQIGDAGYQIAGALAPDLDGGFYLGGGFLGTWSIGGETLHFNETVEIPLL